MSTPYTLIGTPFSTFTRTIALGLHYKGLKFQQVAATPHSSSAQQHHPFGFIPTLVIHEVDGEKEDILLRETHAIARFIDRVAPEPSLHISSGDGGAALEEKMWEMVSLIAFQGFPAVEHGVVKPRVQAIDDGHPSDAEVRKNISEGVEKLRNYLQVIENLMGPEGFAYGSKPSWADFFLYPLLADLRMVPEWEDIASPRIRSWIGKMDELPAAQVTKPGTLSAGARP
ncbi:hypothetical protein AGABI2DRAFT_190119 [Agaricus bisporus var. bisporus H97]|uniref:hypothetical protein n=1 Tax=Agaricus bisporus var. bisporus (strain H97 / ATCC MYA-4626 / FGSC 10389) TaxID=936046 RepID=UPI00029F7F85|nr:hypothetical protein AGABI2DRAFT_190119 [Agaricus bisporus var. bisporus H97]EKV51981.1 hypothetical protein AGABI2DRAFT_190119 [Agaricus bisporus var. bisporus H97]